MSQIDGVPLDFLFGRFLFRGGASGHPSIVAATVGYLVDLNAEVQIVRSCLTAAEHDPEFTLTGYCVPNHAHLAAGGISLFKARQLMSAILRIIPGSSLVVAPTDTDLDLPELAAGLEETFGGGDYSARQRSALLHSVWDHVSSGLDGRESAFELHASGGMPGRHAWLRRSFKDYNSLANAVLRTIDLPMPAVDVGSIGTAPVAACRANVPNRQELGRCSEGSRPVSRSLNGCIRLNRPPQFAPVHAVHSW